VITPVALAVADTTRASAAALMKLIFPAVADVTAPAVAVTETVPLAYA